MKDALCRKVSISGLGLAAGLWFAGALYAAGFSAAPVDYSADRYMSGEGGATMAGKIYYSPGKERMEWGGGEHVTIVRLDRQRVWTLMPKEKMYMEHRIGEGKRDGEYRDCDVRQSEAGEETVNGVRTRKSRVEISCPDRSSYSGTVWLTKENIPMKMETSDTSDPSGKKVFRMELKNLEIGRQDPQLFEIPAGYAMFEMPAMGGMDPRKTMKAPQEAAPPPEKPTAPPPPPTGRSYTAQPREKSAIDQVVDPAKKIKSLFGW